MKRAIICVPDPWNYIPQYQNNYSLMIVNPSTTEERKQYLFDKADWSLLITTQNIQERQGGTYPNEKIYAYTSGTTGDSKFYSFTHEQVDHVCQRIIDSYQLTANDRHVGLMGLWHGHGQMFYWIAQKLNCEATFLPVSKIATVSEYSPTFLTAIPDLLKVLSRQRFDGLRFVRSASSAMPTHLYNHIKSTLGVPVVEAFGMTEAVSHCFTNPLYGEQRIGTVGLPDGIEAQILNGYLHIRGPSVYTAGWINTGDLAEQDSAGYYRILGRADDRINTRGYKLNPLSLENYLYEQLPNLTECAVFGKDTVKCAYVGPYTHREISDALRKLESHCAPTVVRQLESVPKNAMGKVSRSLLEELIG
jgi:acyl-coenzyme A synthetase/AMP-(fatty) acid ligase